GGQGKPPERPIFRSDIDNPTPYNTYHISGLPPGPIANPGRAALEAVANPSRTDDLYFVADGTGGHVFARTLDEHNRNVARWRQIERQQQAATGEASAEIGVDPGEAGTALAADEVQTGAETSAGGGETRSGEAEAATAGETPRTGPAMPRPRPALSATGASR
ncbi:MAG TPA: endolytic transglycosylase MltG, partial [Afifellaceae bacterium]|nr:endolytic transglycosylase MltG [Afifellaceae bacterium]